MVVAADQQEALGEEGQPDQQPERGGVQVSAELLLYQLLRRGLDWRSLTKERGGPLNPNTVSKLRNGGRMHADTLLAVAEFLRSHDVDPDIDSFLVRPAA